jgi:hypothetical protein
MDENQAGIRLSSYRPMKVVEIKFSTKWCANHHDVYGMPFVRVVVVGEHLR